MSERSVAHSTLVIERTYEASPACVFAAWADPAAKSRWFAGPDDWESGAYQLDFRPGGSEHAGGGPPGGPVHTYDAHYYDVVENERIVSTYEMHTDDTRISVSLATVELEPDDSGTKLTYTEHGAFLDGHDTVVFREQGTNDLLDALGTMLHREAAAT